MQYDLTLYTVVGILLGTGMYLHSPIQVQALSCGFRHGTLQIPIHVCKRIVILTGPRA